MQQLTPISIRIYNDIYAAWLLPDGLNAIYVSDGFAFLNAVTAAAGNEYVRANEGFVVSINIAGDVETVAALYRKLNETSAYTLLTRHYNEEYEAFAL